MSPVSQTQIARFGTFEIDLQSGELRKRGRRVKLQELPFRVLALLLKNAGQIVTREELRSGLWPSDTFVDFDNGLNAAINKLREALGDSPDSPRFIETLPRRGYRFIAPIEGGPVGDLQRDSQGQRLKRFPWSVVTAVLVLALLAGIVAWMKLRENPRVTATMRLTFGGRIAAPLSLFWAETPALATDGKRIFASGRAGASNLVSVPATGGEPIAVTEMLSGRLRNMSPDGSNLLVWGRLAGDDRAHLWIQPATGESPHRLPGVDGQDGAWSPDGKSLVYAAEQDLYVARNSGESHKILTLPGNATWIRWSPDGHRIRFTLMDLKTKAPTIWESPADGSHLKRVTFFQDPSAVECCGEWTTDGSYFLFRTVRDNRADVWIVHESGFLRRKTPMQLTAGPLDSVAAIPSPDAKQLFVVGAQPQTHLLRFDVVTQQVRPFFPELPLYMAATTADGEWVTYVEIRGKESSLWRSKADGSGALKLAGPFRAITWPKWSPDKKFIAFAAKQADQPFQSFVVPANGGTPHLLMTAEHNYVDPNWSPDGRTVMLGQTPDYLGEFNAQKAIYLVDVESNQASKLAGSDGLFSPHWSPDGKFVVAMRLGQRTLMLLDVAKQTWSELLSSSKEHPLRFDSPQWSPDGKYIYFNEDEHAMAMRLTLASRKLEPVISVRELRESQNAGFCSFADTAWDGSLFISCWSDGGDLYRLDLDLP